MGKVDDQRQSSPQPGFSHHPQENSLLGQEGWNAIQHIAGIGFERDFEEEKRMIVRDKINLKLLSTLGTRDVKLWLPNGERKGDFYCIDEYMIAINTHSCRLIPDINCLPEIDDSIKKRVFTAAIGRIYIYVKSSIILSGYEIIGIHEDKKLDLVKLYCIINDNYEEFGINKLCGLFSISQDIFQSPKLDGLAYWHQNKRWSITRDISTILDNTCMSTAEIQAPYNPELYQYNGIVTDCVGKIEKRINIDTKKKLLLPVTAWQKSADIYAHFLYLPFSGLQPLFNQDILRYKQERPVLLTDSIEIAYCVRMLNDHSYVCVSWYGGKDAISHVDWMYLENRKKVRYLLVNHSGQSAQNVFETAMAIMDTLKGKGVAIEFEYYNLTNDSEFGHNWHPGFIPQEQVISEAQRLLIDTTVITPKEKIPAKGSVLRTISNEDIPDMRYILYPVIPESSITLLYADTGVGKTWLALSVAFSVAIGCKAFYKWKAERPRSVLYIDSEMDETSFRRRLQVMSKAYAGNDNLTKKVSLSINFRWKSVKSDMLNIADEQDQKTIDGYIQMARQEGGTPVSLLVLDNLSTLTAFADSAKSWASLFLWLKKLKEQGCGVLLLHHANKEGGQRGTSVKTATVDNVIRLEQGKTSNVNALSMTVHIEKGRDIYGVAKQPISIELNPQSKNPAWSCTAATMSKEDKDKFIIAATLNKTHSIKEIAECLGVAEPTVKAWKKKLRENDPDIFKKQEVNPRSKKTSS